jgi:crotonobetainyl-CoA:carnitine CoA-transferase CaiB-like acyl-CoA transferase
MTKPTYPMKDVRVLHLGSAWPGRVAAMLLADQGAEVIEIEPPNRRTSVDDALLDRGKTGITLDLKSESGRRAALALAQDADIVIENLGPGRSASFGVDYPAIEALNPAAVYISLPAFASQSAESDIPGWEGVIDAVCGVYTDIHLAGPLRGGAPRFTSIPLASAYGGVHGAIAASMGYLHRLRSGIGQYIEVPLADAAMSAMALLAMNIENQPVRFDLPPVEKAMRDVAFPILRDLSTHLTAEHTAALDRYLSDFAWPLFATYSCSDGRQIFINAVEHVQQSRALLQALGLLDRMIGDGLVLGSPFDESGADNNVNLATLSVSWRQKLRSAFEERISTRPAAEWETDLARAGVPVSIVRTTKEWLQLPSAIEGGNVTSLVDPRLGETRQAGRFVTLLGASGKTVSPELRPYRHIDDPLAARWSGKRIEPKAFNAERKTVLEGIRVVDISNTIAGPAAARVLAEFGADVIRIDPPAPIAGPRHTMWFGMEVNQGKRAIIVDLKTEEGRESLRRIVKQSDVIIQNFLDESSQRLGISFPQISDANPSAIACQITAWRGPLGGPRKNDPGYDPVVQFGVGIASRYGTAEEPVLHGLASCIDYITGFLSALGIAQSLIARELGRGSANVETSLSMGGQLVQFPYVVDSVNRLNEPEVSRATGYGPAQAVYRAADGWIYLGGRESSIQAIADTLQANTTSYDGIAARIRQLNKSEVSEAVACVPRTAAVAVRRLDELRADYELEGIQESPNAADTRSIVMQHFNHHPSGYTVSLLLPTWYRTARTPVAQLRSAPLPGSDTTEVLRELGFDPEEIAALKERGITRDGWSVLRHYLPL